MPACYYMFMTRVARTVAIAREGQGRRVEGHGEGGEGGPGEGFGESAVACHAHNSPNERPDRGESCEL